MSTPRGWLNFPSRLLCLASVLAAPGASQVTVRVSVDSLGAQGNGRSEFPSISADGRYVAFESVATNFVSGDTLAPDVFVYDRQSGTIERASLNSLGAPANSSSQRPSISADGRYVAFSSWGTNFGVVDNNGLPDVFVRDRQANTTECASLHLLGDTGYGQSDGPSISGDGRYVAFTSQAPNLVNGDVNGEFDCFVRDRQTGTDELVSLDSLGAQGNGHSGAWAISADGRYVAFASDADNLVSGDTNSAQDVFVRDRLTGVTEVVNLDSLGNLGNGGSHYGSLSADGRYVAFHSSSSNLVSADSNGVIDVFVRDRQSGTTERVSVSSLGTEGNGESREPSISADGRFVAFFGSASNLVSGDSNGVEDVFVHDRQSGSTVRVSVSSLGAQGNARSEYPSISADGLTVSFQSLASNLVSGDTNGVMDIFVREICAPATSTTFAGDGINADTITPVNAVLGSSWSAPLTLGHPHGAAGPLVLKLRRSTVNGPNFISPVGGRLTEVLVAGPLYGTFSGTHNGTAGDIAPQAIPDDLSLVGLTWAAQYTVSGGGFADLSQAVAGVIGCP